MGERLTKILLNSVISDASKGARFLSADLKDHFLQTPMPESEYMRVPYHKFPADINEYYNLHNIVTNNGYIFIPIKKSNAWAETRSNPCLST